MATTTNYGWETPDDTDLVKDGALAQRTTANSIDSSLFSITGGKNVGLQYITSQNIGSGVTSVTVSNCFSAAYANYCITLTGYYNSGNDAIIAAKLNNTTNYKTSLTTINYSTGAGGNAQSGSTSLGVYVGLTSQNISSMQFDVFNPFDTTRCTITASQSSGEAFAVTGGAGAGLDANSSTNLVINIGSSQTITGGVIRVYGYRN